MKIHRKRYLRLPSIIEALNEVNMITNLPIIKRKVIKARLSTNSFKINKVGTVKMFVNYTPF